MWRPNNWNAHIALLDNAHLFVNPSRVDQDALYTIRAVEAGADAMLKSIASVLKELDFKEAYHMFTFLDMLKREVK